MSDAVTSDSSLNPTTVDIASNNTTTAAADITDVTAIELRIASVIVTMHVVGYAIKRAGGTGARASSMAMWSR